MKHRFTSPVAWTAWILAGSLLCSCGSAAGSTAPSASSAESTASSASAAESPAVSVPEAASSDAAESAVSLNTGNVTAAAETPARIHIGRDRMTRLFMNSGTGSFDNGHLGFSYSMNDSLYVISSERDLPALSGALDVVNEETDSRAKAAADAASAESDEFFYYTEVSEVLRADSSVVSVLESSYGSFDGAYESVFVNLDPSDGTRLTLPDVVTDTSMLASYIQIVLEANRPDYPMTEEEIRSLIDYGKLNFGVGYDGLHVVFPALTDPEQYGPEAEVTVQFAWYPEIFAPKYRSLPASFGMRLRAADLGAEHPTEYTVSAGDGSEHRIYAGYLKSGEEFFGIDEFCISYDDVSVSMEGDEWAFDVIPYLIRTGDGRLYLYAQFEEEGEHGLVRVYDLNGEEPMYVGECEDWITDRYLEDPSFMELTRRFDLLGTYTGIRGFEVSESGMPETYSSWFDTDREERLLQGKVYFEADVVDSPGGTVISPNETFEPGTQFLIVGTDGERQVDLQASDGRYARVYVDRDGDGNRTVNGAPEEEIFAGILYAS